jgi:hypothetical protein
MPLHVIAHICSLQIMQFNSYFEPMRNLKFLTAIVTFFLIALYSRSDSPLTSTYFANVYADQTLIAEVIEARNAQELGTFLIKDKHLLFYDDINVALDVKIALVNACGWGESKNLDFFKEHLIKKYNINQADIDSILSAPLFSEEEFYSKAKHIHYHDLALLSYTQAMHDYFNPIHALKCAYEAAFVHPESEAANYVLGLVVAQIYFDVDWCMLYQMMVAARDGLNYSTDRIRTEAITAIFEYIGLYASSCEESTKLEIEETVENRFTQEYYRDNPVYQKPQVRQISEKNAAVDLVLLNDPNDKGGIYTNWVEYDQMSDGTKMTIRLKNEGDVPSIETNLQLEILEMNEEASFITTMVVQEKIPPIQPGSEQVITLIIPYYWIFDPDADFIIELDFDNNIQEFNEKNNRKTFHEFG